MRLHPDGHLEVQPGGFAGGKEAVGGFTIVEAESLEEAVAIAKRHRWQAPPGRSWIRSR